MRILIVLLMGFSLLSPSLAAAEEFPARVIRLIVPFPPGGPNDIIARAVGQRMSVLTGQPVIVDNRGGQAGVTGTDAVRRIDVVDHQIEWRCRPGRERVLGLPREVKG